MIRQTWPALALALSLHGACATSPAPQEVREVAIDGGTEVAIGLRDVAVQAEPGQVVRIRNANQGPVGRAAAEADRPGSVVHILVAGPPGPLFTGTGDDIVPTPALWRPCIGEPPAPAGPCAEGPPTLAWDGEARLSTGAIPAGGGVEVRLAEDMPVGEHRLVCALHPQLSLRVLVTERATADPAAAVPPDPVPLDGVLDAAIPGGTVMVGPTEGQVAAGVLVPAEVRVAAGEPVSWTVPGPAPHQLVLAAEAAPTPGQTAVTSQGPVPGVPTGAPMPSPTGNWDGVGEASSGWMSTDPSAPGGAVWTMTVTTPGTYAVRCRIHPSMEGRLVVG